MSTDLQKSVELLAEALVMADANDLQALAALHTEFETFRDRAIAASHLAAPPAAAAADFLSRLILGDAGDPAAGLKLLNRAVGGLQNMIRDSQPPAESGFPIELLGAGAAAMAADPAILAEFLSRQDGSMQEFEALAMSLEQPGGDEKLAALKRALHNLKGESALLCLSDVERVCHESESYLATKPPMSAAGEYLLAIKDFLSQCFQAAAGKGPAPSGPPPVPPSDTPAPAPAQPATPPAASDAEEDFSNDILTGDPGLLTDFLAEAKEHLDAADQHLLTLETNPADPDAINAVFRAFHTIKGAAGFLSLKGIGKLAHEAENLLDKARKQKLVLAGTAMDVTFESVDGLRHELADLLAELSGAEPTPGIALPELLARIRAASQGQPVAVPPQPEAATGRKLGDLLVESGVATRESVENALARQKEPPERKKLGEILADQVLVSRRRVDQALEEQKQSSGAKLGEILVGSGAVPAAELEKALQKQAAPPEPSRLGEILVREGDASASDVARALRAQKGPAGGLQLKEAVKVEAERLDRLLDAIGELVIAESMVVQSPELKGRVSDKLERHLNLLDKITRSLQEMGTSLRMVPVKSTFQKMARLTRDLSRKAGKQVDFVTSGEETELDKSVVDLIGDPLVHMIRNSTDHGIEPPEERRAAGKPPAGRLELKAYHKGGNIHVEVQDDGRGLQRDAILAKAREKGLVKPGDTPSDHEIYNFIFLPGFSTAKVITDVSGRGVGMDVVKKNIEALRGAVDINSTPGKGTVFTIRLPLTMAIIDGMVLRLGEERYIVPTLSVSRTVRPKADDLVPVLGRGEMLKHQDKLIPLFRLNRLFRTNGTAHDTDRSVAVLVEDEGKIVGLMADELLGQQQIVIKTLGESMKGVTGISGGAIMSDGSVGLILDVGGLVRLAHEKDGEAAPAKAVPG